MHFHSICSHLFHVYIVLPVFRVKIQMITVIVQKKMEQIDFTMQ